MILRKFSIFVIIFSFFVFTKSAVLAQSFETLENMGKPSADDISVETSPEIPEANTSLEITLSSFAMDLDNTKIEWFVDGKSIRSGVGLKNHKITTGDVGHKQIIKIHITDTSKDLDFTKELIIEPSGLDLLWEVEDAYINNFYKGKKLPSRESTIKLVAIPNRKNQTASSQKSLIYSWKKNYDNIPEGSGFGKQSFKFKNDLLKTSENIGVTAREGSSFYLSFQEVDFTFFSPIVLFYQKKDGIGIDFWNALNNGFSIGTQDFSIIAEPFFITSKDKNDSLLKYVWKVNGTTIQTPEYKSYITIRGDGGNGTSTVDLDISNLGKLFQQAKRTLTISVFGN